MLRQRCAIVSVHAPSWRYPLVVLRVHHQHLWCAELLRARIPCEWFGSINGRAGVAKVGQLDDSRVRDQQVIRLDVSVHYLVAQTSCGRQALEHFDKGGKLYSLNVWSRNKTNKATGDQREIDAKKWNNGIIIIISIIVVIIINKIK